MSCLLEMNLSKWNEVQKLSQMMQSNIVESIEVTPEEVREFIPLS